MLLRSTYVNDVSFRAENDERVFELFYESKKLLAEGGFNLRKFVINSRSLQERINQSKLYSDSKEESNDMKVKEEDATYAKDTLGTLLLQGEHKVLGVSWRPIEDQLVFDLSNVHVASQEEYCRHCH